MVAKAADDSLAALLDGSGTDARSVVRRDVAPGVDVLPAHPAAEAAARRLAADGGLTTSLRRALRPLLADYDHVVLDTHGDLGHLTLAAVCAADSVLTVFTSDPGSALGAVRVAGFVEQHRGFENTSAVLVGRRLLVLGPRRPGGPRGGRRPRGGRAAAAADPGAGVPAGAERDARQAPRRAVPPLQPGGRGLPGAHRRRARRLRPGGVAMSDLLADLQVDRSRTAPPPPAPAPGAPAARTTAPVLALRVTPLHWTRPSLQVGRSSWSAAAGPVRLELQLR